MTEKKYSGGLCDLHVHSHFSDGTLSPTEIVRLAEEAGLRYVALTDHNTTAGLEEFTAAARESSVNVIPGAELSLDFGDTEVHILALGIDEERYPDVENFVRILQERKDRSNENLIDALIRDGFALDREKILGGGCGHINRAHIAEALVRGGYAVSIPDAFRKYLTPWGGYYVPPTRPSAKEGIEFIRSIGAVPVLAHAFVSLGTQERVEEFLSFAVPQGLCGMEVRYAEYDDEKTASSEELAARFGILPSGGSDFHGGRRPGVNLGYGRGNLQVPMEFAEAILRKKAEFCK